MLSLLCLTSGCAEFGLAVPRWFQSRDSDPETVGIQSPYERIKQLRTLAKTASSKSPEEQEQISNGLVQQIRVEQDPLIRLQMVRTLAVFPTAIANDVLEAGLNDQDEGVRIFCCQAWGKRGGQRAVELLGKVIEQDKDIDVQLAATRSLGNIRSRSALAKLVPALKSKNPALKHLAVESARSISGKELDNNVTTWITYAQSDSPWSPRKSDGTLVSQKSLYKFKNLDEAMGFVIRCIETDDIASLIKAIKHDRKVQPYLQLNTQLFQRLKAQHAATHYAELTKGLSFPANSTEFKVGGHGSQFGHIHIDFEKRGGAWCLKSIWGCR